LKAKDMNNDILKYILSFGEQCASKFYTWNVTKFFSILFSYFTNAIITCVLNVNKLLTRRVSVTVVETRTAIRTITRVHTRMRTSCWMTTLSTAVHVTILKTA